MTIKEKLQSMLMSLQKQYVELKDVPRRGQQFNHREELARLNGQIFLLKLIIPMCDENDQSINIIEQ